MASASTASMKCCLKAWRTCSTVSMEREESLWQANCYTTPHIFVFEVSLTKLANCDHKIAHVIYVPVQVYLAYNMWCWSGESSDVYSSFLSFCYLVCISIGFNFIVQWVAEPTSLRAPTRHVSLSIECYLPASIRLKSPFVAILLRTPSNP